jgi:hypothetical protein
MRTVRIGQYFPVVVLICCIDCAEAKPPSPIRPTSTTQSSLVGSVQDTASQGLANARVEIAEGSQAGAFSVTESDGRFEILGAFSGSVSVRASKEGYISTTQQIQVPNQGMVFRLATLPNLSGNYRITVVAQNCDSQWPMLPTEFRSRTYAASLEQDGTDITVVVVQRELPRLFPPEHRNPRLWGQIRPDGTAELTNYYPANESWDAVFEQVTPNNLLSITVDEMRLTISPEGLSGTFEGSIALYDWSGAGWTHISSGCLSKSHSVTLSH